MPGSPFQDAAALDLQPASKKSIKVSPEADMFGKMQDNRVSMKHATICHDRCNKTGFVLNGFYLREKQCLDNCLYKLYQAAMICEATQRRAGTF